MIRTFFAGAMLFFLCLTGAAQADTMQWKIRSFDSKVVDVKFFSSNRKVFWPGDNQVYTIKNFEPQTYKLSCLNGEKICYGAWQRGNDKKYWGVGHSGKQGCKDCCYTCGSSTPSVNLNE